MYTTIKFSNDRTCEARLTWVREQNVCVVDLGVEERAGAVEWFVFVEGRKTEVVGSCQRGKVGFDELNKHFKLL